MVENVIYGYVIFLIKDKITLLIQSEFFFNKYFVDLLSFLVVQRLLVIIDYNLRFFFWIKIIVFRCSLNYYFLYYFLFYNGLIVRYFFCIRIIFLEMIVYYRVIELFRRYLIFIICFMFFQGIVFEEIDFYYLRIGYEQNICVI